MTTTMTVGPSAQFATLHEIPWLQMGAGDTVQVLYKPDAYRDKIALPIRGTAEAPIEIVGVPGPNGELPILDADGAIEDPNATYFTDQVSQRGIITICRNATQPRSFTPGYIKIKNFVFQNCNPNFGFQNAQGVGAAWYQGCSAVSMYGGDSVHIETCQIQNCMNGLFGKSSDGDYAITDFRAIGNSFISNGWPGSPYYHTLYMEGIGSVYTANTFNGLLGNGFHIKSRDGGMTAKYNRFLSGSAIQLAIEDPEDAPVALMAAPSWGNNQVYGNTFFQDAGANCLYLGGDSGVNSIYPPSAWCWSNTFVGNSTYWYSQWATKVELNSQRLYLANNAFHESGTSLWFLADHYGEYHIGPNWTVNGTGTWADSGGGGGQLGGWGNLIWGGDPGLANVWGWDFSLNPDSPLRGIATDYSQYRQFLPPGAHQPLFQWDYANNALVPRASWRDMGAAEGAVVAARPKFAPPRFSADMLAKLREAA